MDARRGHTYSVRTRAGGRVGARALSLSLSQLVRRITSNGAKKRRAGDDDDDDDDSPPSVQSSRISGVNGSKLAAGRLTKCVACKR